MPHAVSETAEGTAPPPSQDDIRAALERILASPDFTASNQRRKFLRFVVEEALAGRAAGLKGVVIAHEVFRRDDDFNSRSDPVVRLEARRLRRDLDSYYIGPGHAEPVRISIPKGGYAPLFETRHVAPSPTETLRPKPEADVPSTPAPRRAFLTGRAIKSLLIVPAIVVGLLWYGWWHDRPPANTAEVDLPRVAILPFEPLDPSQNTRALASGLSSELGIYLSQFRGFRLYAPMAGNVDTARLADLGHDDIPSYVLQGEVHTEGKRASVLVRLLKAGTSEIVWSDSYDLQLSPGSLIDLRNSVSAEIATALGQPYGPLVEDIRLSAATNPPASLESYLCVLMAYSYRRTLTQAEFGPVLDCLEGAVVQNPGFGDAWAMLGWVHLDAARYGFVPPERVDTEFAAALSAAERAYGIDPANVLALKALSAIHHHIGNYDEGERFGWRALELNPNDPDTLAQVGWRLAARGKFDEGVPLMERSLERTVDPPAWYYHLLSIHHFIDGDARLALELGDLSARKGSGFGNFLVAAAAGALGDAETTRTALAGIGATPSLASDPVGFMRRHGASDEIVEKLMAGYVEARRLVSDLEDRDPSPTR